MSDPGAVTDPGAVSERVVLVLSGPNLNLLGSREPEVYGAATLADYIDAVNESAGVHGFAIEHVQSNREADIVEAVHGARERVAGIIINPGAFTHYAWAIHDALAAYEGPVIELHISNPVRREDWRHTSVVTPVATGTITGFGIAGYRLALDAMASLLGVEA
jgi:3-dehydroquinate dehydratase-2